MRAILVRGLIALAIMGCALTLNGCGENSSSSSSSEGLPTDIQTDAN